MRRHLGETLADRREPVRSRRRVIEAHRRPLVPVSVVTAPLRGRAASCAAAVAVLRDLSRIRPARGRGAARRDGSRRPARWRWGWRTRSAIRSGRSAARSSSWGASSAARAPFREYTDVLLTEVDRVNRIIEMLLDLGRPVTFTSGAAEPPPAPRARGPPRRGGRRAARGPARAALRPEPARLLADEDRILQVFHNLVRNAMEAMPGGGRLTLVTRLSLDPLFAKVDLGHGPASMVEVQVLGRGRGHPGPSCVDRVFTPFFTTKDKGLGLGLALCPPHRRGAPRRASRSRASPGKGHHLLVLPPDRPTERGRSRAGPAGRRHAPRPTRRHDDPRAHPDRRRRGQPALGPREGLRAGRLPGHRGEGRHRGAARRLEGGAVRPAFLDVRMPGIDGLSLLSSARRLSRPTPGRDL